ncbi:MAG: acyl carrier protein [Gammaproteobacteria bacterium]|nr:acyl carrier protein [Gammaproteobacteria bacterium]
MNDPNLINRLSEILGSLLGEDDIQLTAETTRQDIPEWDSFQYINFIVAVEMEYNIKFRVSDVESFRNVGEIATEILSLKD